MCQRPNQRILFRKHLGIKWLGHHDGMKFSNMHLLSTENKAYTQIDRARVTFSCIELLRAMHECVTSKF